MRESETTKYILADLVECLENHMVYDRDDFVDQETFERYRMLLNQAKEALKDG